ncbi:MAG: hypothetical protein JJT94_14230 [Bernardetiaceae bacterium]|nr:hypothetical protein [Bernardetiaceae bacterium]
MRPRQIKDGIYQVPYFLKELDGRRYILPNYLYYGYSKNDLINLVDTTKNRFNIIEFAKANGVNNKKEALSFTGDYIEKVISEYTEIGVVKVLSHSSIGECVIFYLDSEHYIAYVFDLDKVYNEYWQSRFVPENKVEDNWYSNIKM